MATFESYEHGQFCWVDLMSHDFDKAQAFYQGLFGWETEIQDTQGGPPYAIFKREGKVVAGLGVANAEMKAQGVPPVWNSYVNVGNLSRVTDKVSALGGSIVMPAMNIADAGQMAVISDPQGATLCLWQKDKHFGSEVTNLSNTWGWNELLAPHPEKALSFYSSLFGWEVNEAGDYWVITNRERNNAGAMAIPQEVSDMPSHWGVYFFVDDLEQCLGKVKELGGKVAKDPIDTEFGQLAVVMDTDGAAFHVMQLSVPADE